MRYFAMLDGQQCGPYTLRELAEAGVRPDTYVWCKDMADWERARDVADICRHFRRRLAGIDDTDTASAATQQTADSAADNATQKHMAIGRFPIAADTGEDQPDTSRPPQPMILPALIVTLFFFPLTGIVAIILAVKARRDWQKSLADGISADDAQKFRQNAHELTRLAKMLTGISFFLGFILIAFVSRKIAM